MLELTLSNWTYRFLNFLTPDSSKYILKSCKIHSKVKLAPWCCDNCFGSPHALWWWSIRSCTSHVLLAHFSQLCYSAVRILLLSRQLHPQSSKHLHGVYSWQLFFRVIVCFPGEHSSINMIFVFCFNFSAFFTITFFSEVALVWIAQLTFSVVPTGTPCWSMFFYSMVADNTWQINIRKAHKIKICKLTLCGKWRVCYVFIFQIFTTFDIQTIHLRPGISAISEISRFRCKVDIICKKMYLEM